MALQHNTDISNLTWVTISGGRAEAFHELGEYFAERIRAVMNSMPEREPLLAWSRTVEGGETVRRLRETAERDYPEEYTELRAMAEGSGVPFDELFLANIRGDIGSYDGTGCTDILWNGRNPYVAHNEDGAPAVGRDLTLLTIRLDGEDPVFAQWYPGFLPCNAYALTASGMAWGINHIGVAHPAAAPAAGRHFVARRLQRCRTVDEAVAFLQTHPMAGGFSFNLASATERREVSVECAAGRVAVFEVGHDRPYHWHANHLLHMPDPEGRGNDGSVAELDSKSPQESAVAVALGPIEESLERGKVLDRQHPLDETMTPEWLHRFMAEQEMPDGVFRTARDGDPLETLCTTIYDMGGRRLLICGHQAQPEYRSANDLLAERG
ncbi:C45 family autoproteolytic acyltransferase/hydolase [Bifidobacterium miconisargentati]|uniref:C45 family autoproteolytic acyltransferase/hydolase n=1 Tax=Bifidobacterium miconisargentati TaxID=2834437 RepID=UPI001BDD2628|nr:C45 family peptidase [Bifidobacterium miconisargentati]MBW3089555.1 hypothetical protein [Bifidobacterium miconisargentati]